MHIIVGRADAIEPREMQVYKGSDELRAPRDKREHFRGRRVWSRTEEIESIKRRYSARRDVYKLHEIKATVLLTYQRVYVIAKTFG